MNGAADRRRALELVAEEMEERGDVRIARRARSMAWSEDDADASTRRAASPVSIRAVIALDEPEAEAVGDALSP